MWTSPDGYTRNQIDYILIQRKFKFSVVASKLDLIRERTLAATTTWSWWTWKSNYNKFDTEIPTYQIQLRQTSRSGNPDWVQCEDRREVCSTTPVRQSGGDDYGIHRSNDWDRRRGVRKKAKHDETMDRWSTCAEMRGKTKIESFTLSFRRITSEIYCREANNRVKAEIRRAKEEWINDHCRKIQGGFETNNTRKSFQSLREFTTPKSNRISTMKDKNGKVITSKEDIEKCWTEYAKELSNYHIKTDPNILTTLKQSAPTSDIDRTQNITRSEVTEARKYHKKGKAAGIDNIPAELLKTDTTTVDILHSICNKIWQSGVWPRQWTKSIIVPLPKKGELQQLQHYLHHQPSQKSHVADYPPASQTSDWTHPGRRTSRLPQELKHSRTEY